MDDGPGLQEGQGILYPGFEVRLLPGKPVNYIARQPGDSRLPNGKGLDLPLPIRRDTPQDHPTEPPGQERKATIPGQPEFSQDTLVQHRIVRPIDPDEMIQDLGDAPGIRMGFQVEGRTVELSAVGLHLFGDPINSLHPPVRSGLGIGHRLIDFGGDPWIFLGMGPAIGRQGQGVAAQR